MPEINSMGEASRLDGDAKQEEGVSPVTRSTKPSINAKSLASLATAGVLIVSAGAMLFSRWHAQNRQDTRDRQVAGVGVTAASAGAQPPKVAPNPAGAPPTSGGVAPVIFGQRQPEAPVVPGADTASHVRGGQNELHQEDPIGAFAARKGAMARAPAPARSFAAAAVPGTMVDPLDAPILLSPAPALPALGADARARPGAALEDGMAQARARLEETRGRLEQVIKGVATGQAMIGGVAGAAGGTGPAPAVTEHGVKPTSTARIGAARLVAPALTLPRGMNFSCALATRIVSEQAGPVACVVSRNVYGSDGRVLLIERGSHLDGAYSAQVRVGQSRIGVLWDRLRMPNGVVVDLASPATGALGEAGVGGFVDNHWPQRIGAALLLSFIDDAVKIEIAREQDRGSGSGTVMLQGTGSETSTLAGKVLDSTINIPPTMLKNEGEIVAVNVAQDVDFSAVYELRATALAADKLPR